MFAAFLLLACFASSADPNRAGASRSGAAAALITGERQAGGPSCPDALGDLALTTPDSQVAVEEEENGEPYQFSFSCRYSGGGIRAFVVAYWSLRQESILLTDPCDDPGEVQQSPALGTRVISSGRVAYVNFDFEVTVEGADPEPLEGPAEAVARTLLAAVEPMAAPCGASVTTVTPPPPLLPPTNTPQERGDCAFRGVVRDGGARPDGPPEPEGDPLIGVRMSLLFNDTDEEVQVVASDDQGRYELFLAESDLPAGFDPQTSDIRVRLRLEEYAHSPSRFAISSEGQQTSLLSDPIILANECDDGLVERDFLIADLPPDYFYEWPFADKWEALAEIYDRVHRATALADLLQQPLDYGGPLIISAFASTVDAGGQPLADFDAAYWQGCLSTGLQCDEQVFIALGHDTSELTDGGWPDNREYHEFGHHFLADAFNNAQPSNPGDENHAGYYANPSTTDSFGEGFAEFYSMMVSKHIDRRPAAHYYRVEGSYYDMELDFRPWLGLGTAEELGIAGLLLDLEDGPDDYAVGRENAAVVVDSYDIIDDPAYGRLIVGEVTNRADALEYSQQTMVAAVFRDEADNQVDVGYGVTVPWDIPGGETAFFPIAFPEDLVYDSVEVVAFEGHPGNVLTDDDPVDLDLQEVWDTIRGYTSEHPNSNGFLFDVADLYAAFSAAQGRMDNDGDGVDDVDQVFRAHGFFADVDGDRSFSNDAELGRTDHPAFEAFPARVPRRDLPPMPGSLAAITGAAAGTRVLVQASLPAPNEYSGYAYVTTPDDEGYVHVTVPPPEYEATVTLIAFDEGNSATRIIGEIDGAAFWDRVEANGGEPFLTFDAGGPAGSSVLPANDDGDGGSDLLWPLLGGAAAVVIVGFVGAYLAYRRRKRLPLSP